jgi:hypothetical protein
MEISEQTLYNNIILLRGFLLNNCEQKDDYFCFNGETTLNTTIRMLRSVIKEYDNSNDYLPDSVLSLLNKACEALSYALYNYCQIKIELFLPIMTDVDAFYWVLKSRSEGNFGVKVIRIVNKSPLDSTILWHHPFENIDSRTPFFREQFATLIANSKTLKFKIGDPRNPNMAIPFEINVAEDKYEPFYMFRLKDGQLIFELNEYGK